MEIAASKRKKLLYLQGIAGPGHLSSWDDAISLQFKIFESSLTSTLSFHSHRKSYVVPLIDIMVLRQLLDQEG